MKRLLLLSLLLAGAGEAAEPPQAGTTIVVTGMLDLSLDPEPRSR